MKRYSLADKVAFITGAGRGLGAATARALTRRGARVVIADIDLCTAQSVADSLPKGHGLALQCDVTDLASVQKSVRLTLERFGRIDVVIANAGVLGHGGTIPQVKRKARQRIEEAADRMACELLKMATDGNVADSVKLAAIRDALDRAGLAAKNAVEVELGPPKPYEQIFDRIMVLEGGSREAFRRSQAMLESGCNSGALDELRQDIQSPIDSEISDDPRDTVDGSTKRRTIRRRPT